MKADIVIIGGAGHIGLPLGILFASKGKSIILYDKDKKYIELINKSKMPFLEDGGEKLLKKMIYKRQILATNKLDYISKCKYIIVCLGTPINNKFKPSLKRFFDFLAAYIQLYQ